MIKIIAPLTFGVYLFQNNRIIWNILKDLFVFVKNYNVIVIVILVFILALVIFIIGAIVDFLRIKLFKIMRINKISLYLNDFILKCFDQLWKN